MPKTAIPRVRRRRPVAAATKKGAVADRLDIAAAHRAMRRLKREGGVVVFDARQVGSAAFLDRLLGRCT